jgi:N-acetyl-gamma-glutamyl-phosphate reductase
MIKIGVIGGTGYTGVELLRLLVRHPHAEVCLIGSRSQAGTAVADLFPSLRGFYELNFSTPSTKELAECDLVFSATPNGIAMTHARELVANGVKLSDLAADFRFKSKPLWEQWYGMEHACPELLESAVYGLPEVNRDLIRDAQIVANPGCYPTATTLGFLPLVEAGLVDTKDLIADAKSGVTGAGRGASVNNLYSEVADSFKAYGASGHRHLPEIKANLNAMTASEVGLTFVPHLTPMLRGIHSTLYANLLDADVSIEHIHERFLARYDNELFVDVMSIGSHPETRSVKGVNVCRIAVHKAADSGKVVVLSVIDNLVKGAAGQAIQNMNIMFGLSEDTALNDASLLP